MWVRKMGPFAYASYSGRAASHEGHCGHYPIVGVTLRMEDVEDVVVILSF